MKKRILFTLTPLLSIGLVGCSKAWPTVNEKEATKIAESIYSKFKSWSVDNYPFTSFRVKDKSYTKTIYNNTLTYQNIDKTVDFDLNNPYKKEYIISQTGQNGSYLEQYLTSYCIYDKQNQTNYKNLNPTTKTGVKTTNVSEADAKTEYMTIGKNNYLLTPVTNAYNRLNKFAPYYLSLEKLHELYKNNEKYYFNYSLRSDKEGDFKICVDCYMDQDVTKYFTASESIDFIDNKLEYEVVYVNNLVSNLKYTYESNFKVNNYNACALKSEDISYEFNNPINQDKIDLSQYSFN